MRVIVRRWVAIGLIAAACALPCFADDDGAGDGPQAATPTLTDAIQGQDGVRVQTMCTHCNSANIQVGGLTQDLVPISRDGYLLFGGLATSFVFSVLPGDAIANAEVVKGPAEAGTTGAAAGGMIRLTASKPEELPTVDVAARGGSYNLRMMTARVGGRMANWVSGSLVAGTGVTDPVDDDQDGWNDVGAVDRTFAEGGLQFRPGRDHELDVGLTWISEDTTDARGAFDPFAYFGSGGEDAWTREDTFIERQEGRAGWTWRTDPAGTLSIRGLAAEREQRVVSQFTAVPDNPFNEFYERFRIDERDWWATTEYARSFGLQWQMTAGLQADEQDVTALTEDPLAPMEPEPVTDFLETRSAYVDAAWNPNAKWNVQLGLRRDDIRWGARDLDIENERGVTSPRATIRFAPSDAWSLELLAGQTARGPKPIFSEVCCGQQYQRSYFTRPEIARAVGLEWRYQPSPTVRASLYVAGTKFDDHIVRLVGWSQFYIQTYALANVEEARARTIEAAVRWTVVPRVVIDASAGWLTFENTGDPDVEVLVTPPSFSVPQIVEVPMDRIPYVPDRTGSLSVTGKVPGGTLLTVSAGYTGTMMIQQFAQDPTSAQNILLPEMRRTEPFWIINFNFVVPVLRYLDVVGSVNNIGNFIQTDLGDPTTDYNWGPLTGRNWSAGLRFHLDRR